MTVQSGVRTNTPTDDAGPLVADRDTTRVAVSPTTYESTTGYGTLMNVSDAAGSVAVRQ